MCVRCWIPLPGRGVHTAFVANRIVGIMSVSGVELHAVSYWKRCRDGLRSWQNPALQEELLALKTLGSNIGNEDVFSIGRVSLLTNSRIVNSLWVWVERLG